MTGGREGSLEGTAASGCSQLLCFFFFLLVAVLLLVECVFAMPSPAKSHSEFETKAKQAEGEEGAMERGTCDGE